jgi:para-aminobenzoate synthetase/4-amino-4-deoxychorismate lyase
MPIPHPDPAKGVFETMLVAGSEPVELDAHMARLAASLRSLFGAEPPPGAREDVLTAARSLVSTADGPTTDTDPSTDTGPLSPRLPLGRLRLTVAPGAGGSLVHEIAVAEVDPTTVFPGPERGAALRCVGAPGWAGRHKWADRAGLERLEASLGGPAPLLLGEDGAVLETSRANIFAASEGELRTPPLDGRVLPGIARARTIEIAAEVGIEVSERHLSLPDFLEAEEAFLTGSVRGIEPVASLDETELGRAGSINTGNLTSRLAAELRHRWLGVA